MIQSLDLKYLKHFYQFALTYKKSAAIGIAMLPISIACNLLFPWLIIKVVDSHLTQGQFEGLPKTIMYMLLVLLVNYFSDAIYSYYLRKTSQYALFDMRKDMFQRILHLPRTYFDKTPTGVTLSRLTSDLESIGESFVLGVLGSLVFSAKALAQAVRENFTFTLVLDESVPEEELRTLVKSQQLASYAKSAELITKDAAAAALQSDLGEDFVEFLGYNPLSNTVDLHLKGEFVATGDLESLRQELLKDPHIEDVLYDPDLITLVNENIEKISWVLGGAVLVLLLVALALINSSIRLTIYSKRFLLKTMQLVGATSAFIRRPYLLNSLFLGVMSALLSMGLLLALGNVLGNYFPALLALFERQTILVVFAALLCIGLLVPGVSTAIAIRKYLKLRTNELYY